MTGKYISVNGECRSFEADLDTPLLYVLRNELGLNGPRFGCGLAQCGACTVHFNGSAIRACVFPVGSALASDGHSIITLEGIGTPDRPHPIQQAFIDEQAVQCGYCLNGQIMGAVDLLRRNPAPTDEQIKQAMTPYLCRCGTHLRVIRAIKRAAQATGGAGDE